MRRILCSAFLALILPGGAYSAQVPVPAGGQGQGEPPPPPPPPPDASGEAGQGGQLPPELVDPGAERTALGDQEIDQFGLGILVEVAQTPPRLAPGESGEMLLIVLVPRGGSKIRTDLGLHLDSPQGPLVFGPPRFDPPPRGKTFYDDTFLIHVPVTVRPDAAKQPWPVRGTLSLKGNFRSPEPGRDLVREHGHRYDFGKAERGFAGMIRVGKPWPKPPKPSRGTEARGEGSPPAGGSAGLPAPKGEERASDPEEGERGSGPGHALVEVEGEGGESPAGGIGEDDSSSEGEGLPRFWLGLLLAALAGVGLLVFLRKGTS